MATCKQCGSPVKWIKEDGRKYCQNPDGSDHWDLCAKLRFESIKRSGTFFSTEHADGYYTAKKKSGVLFTRISSKRAAKKVPTCKNCVLPWEICPNGCDIEFH